MIVKCDIVKCKYNIRCLCNANIIEIVPNHVSDSNKIDFTEFTECSTCELED